jgi:hypothetical protein
MPAMPASPEEALRELQRQFVREVLHRDAPGLADRIVAGGLPVARRVGIYRTTARENFALALEAAFPLLHRCLGHEEFRQLAWTYQRACPSPSGNLFHVGRQLPGFLADRVAPDEGHLVDVARLEWAIQEALVAPDGPASLDLAALAAVPTDALAGIRFRPHPSARLLATGFAVFALWEALQAGQPLPAAAPGAEHLLVLRRPGGVELQRVPPADFAWLGAVRDGADFATAAAALPGADPAALGALLVRAVASGAVTSFG